MKEIHLLYSCDAWKGHDSMRLVMASTNPNKIKDEVLTQVEQDNMELDLGQEDLKELRKLIKDSSIKDIDTNLTYGIIQVINDGELQ